MNGPTSYIWGIKIGSRSAELQGAAAVLTDVDPTLPRSTPSRGIFGYEDAMPSGLRGPDPGDRKTHSNLHQKLSYQLAQFRRCDLHVDFTIGRSSGLILRGWCLASDPGSTAISGVAPSL